MSLPRGRIEKIVPTEMLFSRLADPSSGSIATQSGASASRISGSSASSERTAATGARAQRVAHHLVGGDIDVLLLIAVGIDAAMPSGNAGQRSIGDQVGKIDRSGRKRLDHGGDRGPVRRVRAPTRSRCERKVTRSSMAVSPVAPSSGPLQSVCRSAVRASQHRSLPN